MRLRRVGAAFVAENAAVTGHVRLGEGANLWYGVVVRGDDAEITIGARTNVQDGTVIHVDPDVPHEIGADVTIGHAAICHGRAIRDLALIGMGSILLSGSVVGEGAIVAAGCVVSEGMEVPPFSLVVGVPARVVKTYDPEARRRQALETALDYVRRAEEHADGAWVWVRPTSP